jgi:hypothetical protein
MRQHHPRITTDHPWGRTVEAVGDTSTGRRAERIAPGPSPRALYEPQPLRELLKPILDELHDKLERYGGSRPRKIAAGCGDSCAGWSTAWTRREQASAVCRSHRSHLPGYAPLQMVLSPSSLLINIHSYMYSGLKT